MRDKPTEHEESPRRFFLDLSGVEYQENNSFISCVVRDPNGKTIYTTLTRANHVIRDIKFWPTHSGQYQVHVFYAGKELLNSPYIVNI